MMMYLPCQIRIIFSCRFEDDFRSVGELVGCEINLAEGAFSDQAADIVVSHGAEIGGTEFGEELLVGVNKFGALALELGF